MGKANNLTDFLTDVADAIREKKGTIALINPQDFAAEIASIESGGVVINNQDKYVAVTKNGTTEVTADAGFTGLGKVTINTNVASSGGGAVRAGAVNFRDYDGTVLHTYTTEEFAELTEMPELPTQAGLICQGWNWSLEDAQSYVATYGMLEIGATYITDDGKTRLYIKIAVNGRMDVPLYIQQTVSNGVTIDWGDGSATETMSGTGRVNTSHTYTEIGEYIISLEPLSGCTLGLGDGSSSYCVMGDYGDYSEVYCNMLRTVEIGSNMTRIGDSAFFGCRTLASIVIPQGVTSIGSNTFDHCSSLASIVIPQGVTSIGSNAFRYCSSLASVVIPQGVTSIKDETFFNCNSLASIVIPQGVTSIGSNAFRVCSSLASVVIPQGVTKINSDTFYSCRTLASIVIPQGVTSIGSNTFDHCSSLASVVIPQGVTSIGNKAFTDCYGMAYFDFSSHTAIPTLSNINAFTNMPSDCKIYVRGGLVSTWKTANVWSLLASSIFPAIDITECTSLTLTADDVIGNIISIKVSFTATVNGYHPNTKEYIEGAIIEDFTYLEIPKNTSQADSVTREISFTFFGATATTTITQGPYIDNAIICKYNVTSTSSATQLLYSSYSNYSTYFSYMLIDGEEVPIAQSYTFPTTGEHEVVFKAIEGVDIVTPYRMFYNITALTEVDCSALDLSKATSTSTSAGTAYMFYGCTNLKKIVLPQSIAYMGYYMFYNCKAVTELTILNPIAPTLYGSNVFGTSSNYIGYTNRSAGTNKFYVPAGATGYDTSYWTSYLQNSSYCGFTKEEIAE